MSMAFFIVGNMSPQTSAWRMRGGVLAAMTLLGVMSQRVEAGCGDYLIHRSVAQPAADFRLAVSGIPASHPPAAPLPVCRGPHCRQAPPAAPSAPVPSDERIMREGAALTGVTRPPQESSRSATFPEITREQAGFPGRVDRPPRRLPTAASVRPQPRTVG